jgi:hypothetical protein
MPERAPESREYSRVGSVRPNGLLYSSGIGALVDLPHLSVIVKGLEFWDYKNADTRVLSEPRLLQRVRQVVGPHVRELRPPPFKEAAISAADAEAARVGVPVAPFPRWMRCTRCGLLAGINADGTRPFVLENRIAVRPDRARFVHPECPEIAPAKRRSQRPTAIPARFVLVCEGGHLDDFPYADYVHRGALCSAAPEGRLTLNDPGSSMGSHITIRCSCGVRRTMQDALRHHRMPESGFLPACRGRHPHLGTFDDVCDEAVRTMVLGASNQWFGLVESALYIPNALGDLERRLEEAWELLRDVTSREVLEFALKTPDMRHLARDFDVEDIWVVIDRRRQDETEAVPGEAIDLRAGEYDVLCDPARAGIDPDFTATVVRPPQGWTHLIDRVVRVDRLRETRALVGFTRVDAPEWGQADSDRRAPISRGAPEWIPAATTHGEGIFIVLRPELVVAWEEKVGGTVRVRALRRAYARWRRNRNLPGAGDERWPGDRYLLIHTLSHLFIREIALECGYSAASIRERLYFDHNRDEAGMLLYTAASDSEGTLGGLVRLADDRELGRIVDQMLQSARRCSSDPLCADHIPGPASDSLHGAACHACLFASETTCENGNRFLDRNLIVTLDDSEDVAMDRLLEGVAP